MKTVARFLILLYPADWRQRYGQEFEALIEDSPTGIGGIFDLLTGAIKMQFAIPSFPKLAVLLSIAGLLAGLGVSFIVTPRYISTSTLIFDAAPGSANTNAARLVEETLSRASLSEIIRDPRLDLYSKERTKMPLFDVIERMRTYDIRITAGPPGSNVVAVSFAYRDRLKARDAVQSIIRKFAGFAARVNTQINVDQLEQIETRLEAIEGRLGISSATAPAGIQSGLQVRVLDPPSLATHPVYPDRARFMSIGFGIGFALAAVIAIFRRRIRSAVPFPAATA